MQWLNWHANTHISSVNGYRAVCRKFLWILDLGLPARGRMGAGTPLNHPPGGVGVVFGPDGRAGSRRRASRWLFSPAGLVTPAERV